MFYLLSDGKRGLALGVRTELQARSLFSIYALGFTAIATEILLLHWRAWQLRESLRLNDREKSMTRAEVAGWSIPMSVGIEAVGLGAALPITYIFWGGLVFFFLAILGRLHQRVLR